MPALFLLSQIFTLKSSTLTGIILLAIGVMGMCADAFFHLLAYFMTDDVVIIDESAVRIMDFMQTEGIAFLIPLILPFFIGSLVLGFGLHKQSITSNLPKLTFILAFMVGLAGAVLVNKAIGYGRPVLVLTILALFAIGHVLIGVELIRKSKSEKPTHDKVLSQWR